MLGTFELVACTEKEMLPFADMLLSLKDQILPEGKSATLHVASANTAAVAGNTSTEIPVGGDLAERGTLRRSGAWVGSDVARVMLEEHLAGVAGLERADKRQADKNQATQSQAPGAAAPAFLPAVPAAAPRPATAAPLDAAPESNATSSEDAAALMDGKAPCPAGMQQFFGKAIAEALACFLGCIAWGQEGEVARMCMSGAEAALALELRHHVQRQRAQGLALSPLSSAESMALSFRVLHHRVANANFSRSLQQTKRPEGSKGPASSPRGPRVVCKCGLSVERFKLRKHHLSVRHKDFMFIQELVAAFHTRAAQAPSANESAPDNGSCPRAAAPDTSRGRSIEGGGGNFGGRGNFSAAAAAAGAAAGGGEHGLDTNGLGQRFKCTDMSLTLQRITAESAPRNSNASSAAACAGAEAGGGDDSGGGGRAKDSLNDNGRRSLNDNSFSCRQPVFGQHVACPAFAAAFDRACARLRAAGLFSPLYLPPSPVSPSLSPSLHPSLLRSRTLSRHPACPLDARFSFYLPLPPRHHSRCHTLHVITSLSRTHATRAPRTLPAFRSCYLAPFWFPSNLLRPRSPSRPPSLLPCFPPSPLSAALPHKCRMTQE